MTTTYRGEDLLVSTQWLADRLDSPDFVLIDAGEAAAYRRTHIPGAVGVPHPYLKGKVDRRLVMPAEEFEALARRWGVSNDTPVIIYDDNASLHAARAWWIFQLYGHHDVRVVDGGFNAWIDEGRPLATKNPRPEPGDFSARSDESVLITLDELQAQIEAGSAPAIWDTRSAAEWDGSETRGNKRAGRVPGAKHLEWRTLMQGPPARRFRPREEIRQALSEVGIDPAAETVIYCQAGIRAAYGGFVLRLLGNDRARVYDGSMGEWANEENTPLTLEG